MKCPGAWAYFRYFRVRSRGLFVRTYKKPRIPKNAGMFLAGQAPGQQFCRRAGVFDFAKDNFDGSGNGYG